MILKVHADRTDTLNLIDIGNEFVKVIVKKILENF